MQYNKFGLLLENVDQVNLQLQLLCNYISLWKVSFTNCIINLNASDMSAIKKFDKKWQYYAEKMKIKVRSLSSYI